MAAGESAQDGFRSGRVAIVGRPNVGKSTLLNSLVGQKLSIVSRRPQTTRWHVSGIRSTDSSQVVFIDTPGVQTRYRDAISRHMAREVTSALEDIDLVLFVIEAQRWSGSDERIRRMLPHGRTPVILVINKIDKLASAEQLLPFVASLPEADDYAEIVPVSAQASDGTDRLLEVIGRRLPVSEALYPDDYITDRSERFLAAELVREKLTERLGAEVPYRLSVTVDRFRRVGGIANIDATIWVETEGQKAMVIGRSGAVLKAIGRPARMDMERLFDCKVHLRTWVKVRKNWRSDVRVLRELGYAP